MMRMSMLQVCCIFYMTRSEVVLTLISEVELTISKLLKLYRLEFPRLHEAGSIRYFLASVFRLPLCRFLRSFC